MLLGCQKLVERIYRVSQKKRNGGFSIPCRPKISYFLTSLDITYSAEENDTKIVKFGCVILNLCTLLEKQSFSNFADKQSIRRPVEAHCSVFLLLPRTNGLPQNTMYGWKVCPATILRSPVAKIQRNFKMTVFQEMVIESKLLNQI